MSGLVKAGDTVTAALGPMRVLSTQAIQPDDTINVLTTGGQCVTLNICGLRVDLDRLELVASGGES